MQKGWVKLHRKILENDIFRHDRTGWHVFETLLILCDTKTGTWSGGMYQLADACNELKPTVYKAILRLEEAGMINREVNSKYTVYNISNWVGYQADGKQSVNSEETESNTLTRIKNKELRNTNVLATAYGKPEINELITYWKDTTGIELSSKTKANRNAANNLLKKHGMDKLKALIRGVNAANSDKYAPRISDFVELQSKTNELITWGKKNVNKGVISV